MTLAALLHLMPRARMRGACIPHTHSWVGTFGQTNINLLIVMTTRAPGHCGIRCNEDADDLTRDGSSTHSSVPNLLFQSHLVLVESR